MISLFHRFSLAVWFSSLLIFVFLFAAIPAGAADLTNPEGTTITGDWDGTTGDDTMTNYGTVTEDIVGHEGDDTIINYGTVTVHIYGRDDDDTIINHGTVGGALYSFSGHDTVTNYGAADRIVAYTGNDIITNYGTITQYIYGQAGDDTIINYGTVNQISAGADNDTVIINGRIQDYVSGGSGTDTLTMDAGAFVGGTISTFENITIKGDVSISDLNLAGLNTMAVTMTSNTAPVTAGTVTNATGTLNVDITGGSFKDGQTVSVFSTGSVAGFGTETVTNSSSIFSFTINNAQVTASRDTTFNTLVSGAADKRLHTLAALFEENADTATGDLADVMGKLNFMNQAQMESAFRQMAGLTGTTQAMTHGIRMGSGAAMARMGSMLASRGTTHNRIGFTSLPAISLAHEKQARSFENQRFMKRIFSMINDDTSGIDREDVMNFSSPDLCAVDLASLGLTMPSVGELGPSLDLGTGDTGGVWLRTLGGVSHQKDKGRSYGYNGEIYGLAGGVDTMFSKDILAGFFGSWTRSDLEYDDPGKSEADGNTFQMGFYSAWGPEAWFFETALAATYGTWDSKRRIVSGSIDETAVSDQDVYGGNLSFTMGRDSMAGSFIITPVAGLEYTLSHEKGYAETGAGALNQTVSSVNRQFLRSMAGVKIERPYHFEDKNNALTLAPAIKAQWLHEFLGEEELYHSYAGMGTVAMYSPAHDRDIARLGASLTLAQANRYSGYISYETDISETYMNHTLAAGFRMPF